MLVRQHHGASLAFLPIFVAPISNGSFMTSAIYNSAPIAFTTALPLGRLPHLMPAHTDNTPTPAHHQCAAQQPRPLVPFPSPRVAVIGAGAAGLQAARQLLRAGYQPRVYEATDHIGGVWAYSPHPTPSSPIYESLRTNIPKYTMMFENIPYPSHVPSYPAHSHVLQYLHSYARRFNLQSVISFSTRVTSVRKRHDGLWNVTATPSSPNPQTSETHTFHAVFVCSGHFVQPNQWVVDGLHHLNHLGIPVMHSISYRTPHPYVNKRVLVVGAGPSGIDIALEIAAVASHVYLSHSQNKTIFPHAPPSLTEIGRISRIQPDGSTLHQHGVVNQPVEMVVTCTGYRHHYPFLRPGDAGVHVFPDGQSVRGLVRHLVSLRDPTLCIIGTPSKAIPFPMFEEQVAFVLAVLEGRIDGDELRRLEEEERSVNVDDKNFQVLGKKQWDYIVDLNRRCGRPVINKSIIEMSKHSHERRHNDPKIYRNIEYTLDGYGPGMWSVSNE